MARPARLTSVENVTTCDLVLPCRDEAPALRGAAAAGPGELLGDRRRQRLRATTRPPSPASSVRASSPRRPPGYGAAVHAGIEAATADYVAVMDGDGSFDPDQLLPLLDDVASGRADIAVGRRRPVRRGVWPWHARAGNALITAWLRRRIRMDAHDIAPMRVCRRQALLDLGLQDRRFGYPVELLQADHPGRVAGQRARRGLPPARRGYPVEGVGLRERAPCGRRATSGRCCDEGAGGRQGPRRRPGEDPARRAGRRRAGRRPRRRRAARHHRRLPRGRRRGTPQPRRRPGATRCAATRSRPPSTAGRSRRSAATGSPSGWSTPTSTPVPGSSCRSGWTPRRSRPRTLHEVADAMAGHDAVLAPGHRRRLVGARAPRRRRRTPPGAGARCRPTDTFADTQRRARAGRRPRRARRRDDRRGHGRRRRARRRARSRPPASPRRGAPSGRGRPDDRAVLQRGLRQRPRRRAHRRRRASATSRWRSRCTSGAEPADAHRPRAGRAVRRTDPRHRLRAGPADRGAHRPRPHRARHRRRGDRRGDDPRARSPGAAARRLRPRCPARGAGTPPCSPTATSASAATRSGCCAGCARCWCRAAASSSSSAAPARPWSAAGRPSRHATAAAARSAGPPSASTTCAAVAAAAGFDVGAACRGSATGGSPS